MTKYGKILADGTLKLCNGTIKVNGRYKTNPSKAEAAQAGYYPVIDIPDDKMPPTGRNGFVWSKKCYRVVNGMILPMCVLEKQLTTISEPYNDKILMEKINAVVKRVTKSASVISLLLLPLVSLSDNIITVRTARKDEIYNNAQIVTNVEFNASALDIPRITESTEHAGWAANSDHATGADAASHSMALINSTDGMRTGDTIVTQLDAATETNAAQSAALLNTVSKDGDTMTGTLTVLGDIYGEMISAAGAISASAGDVTATDPDTAVVHSLFAKANSVDVQAFIADVQSSIEESIATSSRALDDDIQENKQNISTLGSQVNAIGSYLHAEDARFVSTNYDSVVRTPEAYVEVRLNDHGTNKWVEIWREMTRWGKFVGKAFDWDTWTGFHTWATNVTAELSFKADRCWGIYDSETGGYSPEGYTQISSPNILISSGMAYQRTVTSDGSVWVLQCNNGVAQIGGDTNGYFRIMDSDGNTQFEIIKGDRREMGADASGITVNGNVMTIPYSVEAAEHPVIQCTATLDTPNWKNETDADCPCTVSWSGSSGAWVATVTPKSASPSMFVKATYIAGGETYIRNVAPVGMGSIILPNGVKYYLGTATISGYTVLTLSTTAP